MNEESSSDPTNWYWLMLLISAGLYLLLSEFISH